MSQHKEEVVQESKGITNKMIDSNRTALTDVNIEKWCNVNGIHPLILDLKDKYAAFEKYAFIFTGNEPNEFNNGVTNHWLLKIDNRLFDSYGEQANSYNVPTGMKIAHNVPNQYQQWAPASVCGEYTSVVRWLYEQLKPQDLDIFFSHDVPNYFVLTTDKFKNDQHILAIFKKGKNKKLEYDENVNFDDSDSENTKDTGKRFEEGEGEQNTNEYDSIKETPTEETFSKTD